MNIKDIYSYLNNGYYLISTNKQDSKGNCKWLLTNGHNKICYLKSNQLRYLIDNNLIHHVKYNCHDVKFVVGGKDE